MTREQALSWLDQVDAKLFHHRKKATRADAWVAVVRTPGASGRSGKIILAFGNSLEAATVAAEQRWTDLWTGISSVH